MADDFSRILNEVHSAQSSQNSFVMVHPITGEVMEGIGQGPLKWGEYPDDIEPGTDESYQYDIFRSKYRPYPSDILSANSIGEITEQPEGSQINDPYWQIASRIMYEYTKPEQRTRPNASVRTGRDFPKVKLADEFSAEEMAQWGVSFMNSFENNIPAMVVNTAKLQDAPPEVTRAMYYLLETSDRDGILGSNILESAGQMLIDPSTWIGLGTFGIGLAGRQTGKALSKMGVKELLKNAISTQSVKTSTLALAGESAFFGAVDNLARQEVAIEAEQQDELDLPQLATTTAISGALGETLGAFGPTAVEGGKRVIREISERLNAPGKMPTVGSNLGNVADFQAPTEKEPGIIAFHGSGRDFDKFKLEKIGTGEGNQVFGYGLYFSDLEDIAQFYRKMLETDGSIKGQKIKYKGQKIDDLGDTAAAEAAPPSYFAISDIAEEMSKGSSAVEAKEFLLNKIDKNIAKYSKEDEKSELGSTVLNNGQTVAEFFIEEQLQKRQALLQIEPNDIEVETGKVYQVELDVSPDKLVDFYKTLGQQNEFIQNNIKKVVDEINIDDAVNLGFDPFRMGEEEALQAARNKMLKPDMTFGEFLDTWTALRGADNAGEKLLNKHGIKGIKYLENVSRQTSGGKLLNIKKTDEGFKAQVVVTGRHNRSPEGRIVTTSKPYETEAQAKEWAESAIAKSDHNYVIFDDRLINIMKKYGIVGPVAVTAQTLSKSNNEQDSVNKEPQT